MRSHLLPQSRMVRVLGLALAIAIGALTFSPPARAAAAAEAFVVASVEEGSAILKAPSFDADERRSRFRDFLLSIVDTKRVALFTLGVYARNASETDKANFVAAFTDFVVSFYHRGFDSYAGQTIVVTGSVERATDDAVVSADVIARDGKAPPAKIAFRVRRDDGGRQVLTDLQIEGAWLALTQRSEFTAYLQQHGGDIGQLARELEKRAGSVRARGENALQS